jgi:excisionase family DNA binding protein
MVWEVHKRFIMTSNSSHSKDGAEKLVISEAEPLWTVEELANYLRVKAETVRMMARAQKIPAIKVGKAWRFRASDIKEMLQSKAVMKDSRVK